MPVHLPRARSRARRRPPADSPTRSWPHCAGARGQPLFPAAWSPANSCRRCRRRPWGSRRATRPRVGAAGFARAQLGHGAATGRGTRGAPVNPACARSTSRRGAAILGRQLLQLARLVEGAAARPGGSTPRGRARSPTGRPWGGVVPAPPTRALVHSITAGYAAERDCRGARPRCRTRGSGPSAWIDQGAEWKTHLGVRDAPHGRPRR